MKKLLALLLAALMLFSLVACSGDDKDDGNKLDDYVKEDEDDITFITNEMGQTFHFEPIDSESVRLTKYEGPSDPHTLEIPATLNNKNVTEIGNEAFYFCSVLTSVKIPETITKIGAYAFAGCSSLGALVIPSSVSAIGEGAFFACTALESVSFASSAKLVHIEQYTFQGCTALKWITIPAYVKTVGSGAFYGCTSLATVTVTEGVQVIGAQAFMNCDILETVKLPASVSSIGSLAFYGSKKLTASKVSCPAGSYAEEYIQTNRLHADNTAD